MEINKGKIIIGVSRRSARWRFWLTAVSSFMASFTHQSSSTRKPLFSYAMWSNDWPIWKQNQESIKKILKANYEFLFFLHVLWSSLTLYLSLSHSLILLFLIINAVNNLSHKISIYLALQAFTSEVSKYKLSWSVDQ